MYGYTTFSGSIKFNGDQFLIQQRIGVSSCFILYYNFYYF